MITNIGCIGDFLGQSGKKCCTGLTLVKRNGGNYGDTKFGCYNE